MVNKKTFFSHFFRTQFGWPYPITQGQIDRARAYSRDLWFNNKWKGQKYPLSWLIDKFLPIPGWSDESILRVRNMGSTFRVIDTYADFTSSHQFTSCTDTMGTGKEMPPDAMAFPLVDSSGDIRPEEVV